MKRQKFSRPFCLLAGYLIISSLFFTAKAQEYPFQNPVLSAQERANDLITRLTLEEKIALMQYNAPAISRFNILPYDWWNEALHGVARNGIATVYPQAIAMAASFDDAAVKEVFESISDEARAKHHFAKQQGKYKRYQGLTFWTPNINIFRDPRWGRGQETYGEDPYLTSRMGVAAVEGLQGDTTEKYLKTHACAKHFAVHSGPEWNRHRFNAQNINPRDLWETYLPAFKVLVTEAGVAEVMCAYNRFEGKPCCGNDELLNNILRQEWGYQGMVVSDCQAIRDFYKKGDHETHPDSASASVNAVLAGTDLECGNSYRSLLKAVANDSIKESDIDIAALRVLKARFDLGMMDPDEQVGWSKIPYSTVDCEAHRQQALDIARKSMTLLSNRESALPLSKDLKKIVVVGPNADDSVMLLANYNGTPSSVVTILDGIQAKLPEAEIIYEKGCEWASKSDISNKEKSHRAKAFKKLAAKAKTADAVIFVGGITPKLEGEEMKVNLPGFRGGDRTDIELPQIQRDYIQALRHYAQKLILVMCSGSALALVPENQTADAILQAWYPGQAGGTAVADVLFGDYNPAGRLPITFYKSMDQLPDFEDYNMTGRTYRYLKEEPLFPFGHGLSYTTFDYRNVEILGEKQPVSVKVTLKNTGTRDGEEVIQVYIRKTDDANGPNKDLRAFKRVALKTGETKTFELSLREDAFAFFDEASNLVKTLPGQYEILVGGSSDDNCLKKYTVQL